MIVPHSDWKKRLPIGAPWKCSPDISVFKIQYQTGCLGRGELLYDSVKKEIMDFDQNLSGILIRKTTVDFDQNFEGD